jgi:hypothetical protein
MLVPIRIWISIKTMPILIRSLSQFLHMLENQNFFTFVLVIALPLNNVLSFSSVSNESYELSILDSILKFSGKKSTLYRTLFHLLGTYSDPDRPHPDRYAQDADPDLDPAK